MYFYMYVEDVRGVKYNVSATVWKVIHLVQLGVQQKVLVHFLIAMLILATKFNVTLSQFLRYSHISALLDIHGELKASQNRSSLNNS